MNNVKLRQTAEISFKMLEDCSLCPRRCGVNRLKGEVGFCKTGLKPKVFSYMLHHGEEPPVSGENGSGTIFFSGCNMSCCYCQNSRFSQEGEGREVDFEELAGFMLDLQDQRCHNLNLVTPTHIMPQILRALVLAVDKGFNLPVVYNTSGYELASVVRLLEGIVDVYLADLRYADNTAALKYSNAPDYPPYSQEALKEMHRQVGIPVFDQSGVVKKGLIIRHLVLPNTLSGTAQIMEFIAKELSPAAYISLMSQYFPNYKAGTFNELNRRITYEEYEEAKQAMNSRGLENGWTQDDHGLIKFAGTNIKPLRTTKNE